MSGDKVPFDSSDSKDDLVFDNEINEGGLRQRDSSEINHIYQKKRDKSKCTYPSQLNYGKNFLAKSSYGKKLLSLWLVTPILILGIICLGAGIILDESYGGKWWILLIKETGAVLVVVAVIHAMYEIVIHKVLHGDIVSLGATVEALQRTVSIVGGAIESGLAAVYSSRDDVNRAIQEEMERMPPKSELKLLGISLGAFLCPHGALHGEFRKLLERSDVKIEAIILDTESQAGIERAKLEEPRFFKNVKDERTAYEKTRCHNELKTATDFAKDLADRCYYRDQSNLQPINSDEDAPNEPKVNAKFSYGVYSIAPLCYLVIFDDYMFLESYHYAGRGGEAPVLKIGRHSGDSRETTSLFRIYENHFKVMKKLSCSKNFHGQQM